MSSARSAHTFVAIDFETANRYPNSACAIGLVRVENRRIVAKREHLIRPPFRTFEFTSIHGITWEQVADAMTFGQLWPSIQAFVAGAQFLAAHNAPFDRGVLRACCAWYDVQPPDVPFACSCRLARRTWSLPRYNLATVASHLGIGLRHHDALSDAEACARIILAGYANLELEA